MKIHDFKNKKLNKQKISMVTCYDYWSAKIIDQTEIDCVLVGDSLGMVMHGHPTTLNATMEMMVLHTQAVARGTKKFIVGDMPFISYRKDLNSNVEAAADLMRAGANAIKLEGAHGNLELVTHLVHSGIPVMGHIGLTPQSIHQLGGFKVQGKTPEEYDSLIRQAKDLQKAGCFALVLECVPAALAEEISKTLEIPTIGIGAGVKTDGQVLVLHDLLGLQKDFSPKFVKKYINGFEILQEALNQFHGETTKQIFPSEKESYL